MVTMQLEEPGQKPIKDAVYWKKHRVDKARKRKLKIIHERGDQCMDCKGSFPPHQYDFHHRDPSTKLFVLGGAGFNRKWETVLTELFKCDMLCAQCHRDRHFKERNEDYESQTIG